MTVGHGETEAHMVAGPLLLGTGIIAGHSLVWVLIGLGAGITLRSMVSRLDSTGARGR